MTIFNKLTSTDPKTKFGFTKELLQLAKESPETLYSNFNDVASLLRNENNIIKWTGIDLIGCLSAVDKDSKVDKLIPALVTLLHEGHLITTNHCIFSLGLIAQSKPEYRSKILDELLRVSKDKFDTEESKNIAIGKVLDALKQFVPDIQKKKAALNFIEKATDNSRNLTRKRAIKLWGKVNSN
jgi:hypothetical protein